ncbi:rRNA maturation RNase YbeY [Roseiarcaceae bacterium H3SJ34-1]|uniref:rRNA maturation RNase YbeY n=1 Tax=Terripilifer ovatus TaxID=3032367 RepID=UPI003AB95244|nr:rRNA maturation RNase YbeY [Roseiarcaceae bacterium H3SJ34-1]
MSVTVDISNEFDHWPAGIPDIETFTTQAIAAALAGAKVALQDHVEVSIVYCDDAFIHDLNKQWRRKDAPTNVLSFPLASGAALATTPMLGDIIISCETVMREARDEGKSFADHLAHMLVHGALHLAGYDHEIDADAETMEALERTVLSQLGVDDPYRDAL